MIPSMSRPDNRANDEIRPVRILPGIAPHATGSALVQFGRTQVICSAMVDEAVPRWMSEEGVEGGWLTAEYSMLPYSTHSRKSRDVSRGKVDGRAVEIQRLIGRALRAMLDLKKLGPRTIWIDCDVLQADGGTRTAAITGACVAVCLACKELQDQEVLETMPIRRLVSAVSAGVVEGEPRLDLCYEEDRAATVDMNVVMTDAGEFVEVQGSGEEGVFSPRELEKLVELARGGMKTLFELQREILKS